MGSRTTFWLSHNQGLDHGPSPHPEPPFLLSEHLEGYMEKRQKDPNTAALFVATIVKAYLNLYSSHYLCLWLKTPCLLPQHCCSRSSASPALCSRFPLRLSSLRFPSRCPPTLPARQVQQQLADEWSPAGKWSGHRRWRKKKGLTVALSLWIAWVAKIKNYKSLEQCSDALPWPLISGYPILPCSLSLLFCMADTCSL